MGAAMKVVILAGSVQEGWSHARLAGLSRNDTIIPGSLRGAEGLLLEDADLIVELPSFEGHPHRDGITSALRASLAKNGANPPWERVGR